MLEDKVVVVTGGGKGIGRHAALTFAREKAKVVIIDVSQEWLDKTGPELGELTDALGINADIRDEKAVRRAFDEVVHRFGQIDVLVNDAAIVPHFAWGIPRWPLIRDMDLVFLGPGDPDQSGRHVSVFEARPGPHGAAPLRTHHQSLRRWWNLARRRLRLRGHQGRHLDLQPLPGRGSA